MRKLLLFIGFLAVFALGLVIFIRSGVYNVSARVPHYNITSLLIDSVKDRSIITHAARMTEKPIAGAGIDRGIGIAHYHAMCRRCHGAPGILRDEFASGLYPSPPNLDSEEETEEWTDAQLFWIVSNGLKLTGMPAFGDTHTPEELWEIIGFVNRMPEMDEDDYQNQMERFGIIDQPSHDHH